MNGEVPGFRGELLWPGDEGYSASRQIWNGAIERHPALIARCSNEEDATAALKYALSRRLPLSVRGGGHNVSGSALAEGGVVIDFSSLRGAIVDPDSGGVRVQPGALWADVDAASQRHGLAVPGGIVTHTGVAGLTLGGGFGWLSRRWGLTSDNLLSVRMLLADGSRVEASEQENPELFWAVRGGGGNFGIVTEFRFRSRPLGTHVLAGPILFRAEQAGEFIAFYREFIAQAPDELSVYLNLRTAPPLEWVPERLRGTDVLLVIPFFVGDPREGEDLLWPLREFGPPAADLLRYMPYVEHQAMFDAGVPHHWGYYWKSHYLPPLSDAAVEVLLEHSWAKSSPATYTLLFHMGGAMAARSEDSSAASGRDAAHAMNVSAVWPAGGPYHPDIEWCRDYFAAMEPHATGGVYVNFLHNDEGEARIRAAYGSRYERLARIKAEYDPDNVFRSNQNIKPSPVRQT